jgi:hypothetical protein
MSNRVPRRLAAPAALEWAAALALALALAFAERAPALTFFEDIVFPATPVESRPIGIEFGVQTGPTGGPYDDTAFFFGVASTEARGMWAERDNSWGVCYNLDNCTGALILPDEHAFVWGWEASYKATPSSPTLIENNVNVRYVDGSFHRPWAFHINTDTKRASLHFLPSPGVTKFQINNNGNVVIGTPFRQPAYQLEVVGDTYVTKSLRVDGPLTVGGLRVAARGASPAQGVVRWGLADGGALSSGAGVCAASGLACGGAVLQDGSQYDCNAAFVPGTVLFALCR